MNPTPPFKTRLLSGTVLPLFLGAGAAIGGIAVIAPAIPPAIAASPCGARNPCNPCAAKNPCAANPCAAKNPCAAANPCATKNPCAAATPCNPCGGSNPCAAGGGAELTAGEAVAAYDCLIEDMRAAYGKSGSKVATDYTNWRRYNDQPYPSGTHGGRYVNNYANATAKAYRAFEQSGEMPAGSVLAKDSFSVSAQGHVGVGPLFLMEKMPAGFNADSGDWRYSMIMPNGAVFGETKGKNAAGVGFCAECHMSVAEDQDSMFFLPDEYRIGSR